MEKKKEKEKEEKRDKKKKKKKTKWKNNQANETKGNKTYIVKLKVKLMKSDYSKEKVPELNWRNSVKWTIVSLLRFQ